MKSSKMNSLIPFETNNGNYYLYFIKEKYFVISNEEDNLIIKKLNKGNSSINELKFKDSFLKNIKEKSLLLYLVGKNYHEKVDLTQLLLANLTTDFLEKILSSIKQITFEMTQKCNLNCTYCGYGDFYNDYGTRKNLSLNFEYAKLILDFLKERWNTDLNNSHNRPIFISFYGGEPLIEMDTIKKIINYSKTLKLKHNYFVFNMTTNGVLLKEHIDFLVKNNVKLLISIDGNESNNAYRKFKNGKPSFSKVFSNICYIKQKFPKYFNTNVEFNSVLHKLNSAKEIIDFISNKFNKTPRIAQLNTAGIAINKKQEFWDMFQNKFESFRSCEETLPMGEEIFIDTPKGNLVSSFLNENLFFNKKDYCDLQYKRIHNHFFPSGTCLPMTKKIFITASGKILACEKISHEFSIGNITKEGIDINLSKIKNSYNEYYNKLKKMCSKCYNVFECKQCMFYLNIKDGALKCNGFTSYKQYKEKLKDIIEYLEENPEKIDFVQKNYEYSF